MEKEEQTVEELVDSLRADVREMSLYCAAHPEFVESLKTLKVSYDRDTRLLVCQRTGYPDLTVQISLNEEVSEAFGEETYVRLLAIGTVYEYDKLMEERRSLEGRINAPYPRTLQ